MTVVLLYIDVASKCSCESCKYVGTKLIRNIELSYRDGALAFGSAKDGQGEGNIYLDNVQCKGTETNIGQCRNNGAGMTNCDHSKDVGVRCMRGKGHN